MPTDSRAELGFIGTSGSPRKTSLGTTINEVQNLQELTRQVDTKVARGWLKDVRLPLDGQDTVNETDRQTGLGGLMVQIMFDSREMARSMGTTWFRLEADISSLLQTHGTREAIKRARLRVELRYTGGHPLGGKVHIVNDSSGEKIHRGIEKTDISVWQDLLSEVQSVNLSDLRKVWRATKEGPFLEVSDNHIKLGFDKDNFIIINPGGITTQGKMNHQNPPTDTTYYGFFSPQSEWLGTFMAGPVSPPMYNLQVDVFKSIPGIIGLARSFLGINRLV